MHDINEGAIPFLLRNLFNFSMANGIVKENVLKKRFQFFDYGILIRSCIPSVIDITKRNLNQKDIGKLDDI